MKAKDGAGKPNNPKPKPKRKNPRPKPKGDAPKSAETKKPSSGNEVK